MTTLLVPARRSFLSSSGKATLSVAAIALLAGRADLASAATGDAAKDVDILTVALGLGPEPGGPASSVPHRPEDLLGWRAGGDLVGGLAEQLAELGGSLGSSCRRADDFQRREKHRLTERLGDEQA